MFGPENVSVCAPPGVTSASAGLAIQSEALLWLTTKIAHVSPLIAGNRVGSMATRMGALTLNARTYSKNGYCASELPASSVFVIAAAADSGCRPQRTANQTPRPIRCVLMDSLPFRRRGRIRQAPGLREDFLLRGKLVDEVRADVAQQRRDVRRPDRRAPHAGEPLGIERPHAGLLGAGALGLRHGRRDALRQLGGAEPDRHTGEIGDAGDDPDD